MRAQEFITEVAGQKPIIIYTNNRGATIDDDIKKSLPVTQISFDKLHMWESHKSMKDLKVADWVNNKLLPELEQNGILKPLLVWNNNGEFFVIDGNHRFIAYQEAGYQGRVPVQIVPDNMITVSDTVPGQQGMAENKAAGIDKMFNNLGDPVYANLQRVALLAMQGRQSEAAGRLQTVIKDADPAVQKKITDAVNNIKPVTINGRVADSSTLDKSKQHNDWITNTFIPWVQSLLGQQGVAEGSEQKYLWHGSRQKIPMLEPRQSVDTGGAAGSNQNAIYATSDPKVAIAVGGLTTPDSDTAMFPNDPQMVLFSGKIRKGENVYLHKLPFYSRDGKPQFVQGAHDREFYSIPGVKGIKPTEIKAVPVDKYLNLIRKATPADLELRKKNMKEQGVAEAGSFSYGAKKPRKGSVADLAAKKRQEQEQGQQPIEPKDQQVGVARVTKGVAEAGPAQGEYSRVLTALRLYYPRFEIEELNTPDWHRVIANKANVTPEYAGQVINDFVKDSQPDEEENLDWMDDTNDVREGVAEGAVEDLAKDLKNPHSYNAIDHMMQTIADKSNVTPKELHNQFVEKYGMTPDEWIKNEQGVEETYGAKLHTEYKRNRFKQLEKIKQQQEKALGLGEAGCNMTYEGRYCSEHGMMECPGYSMTETSVQDKLHQQHQELRKQRGLPDPSYYKKLAAQKQAEIDALRAEIAADRAKSMKESLRPGERHHYEDDPKTGKRVYKGIRGDQYDAPKKTTGHEPDADRDRAAHRAHDRSMTESIESYMEELDRAGYGLQEEKVRLDPKCWKGKKIGSPKTKVKGGVRVNNCVPK